MNTETKWDPSDIWNEENEIIYLRKRYGEKAIDKALEGCTQIPSDCEDIVQASIKIAEFYKRIYEKMKNETKA